MMPAALQAQRSRNRCVPRGWEHCWGRKPISSYGVSPPKARTALHPAPHPLLSTCHSKRHRGQENHNTPKKGAVSLARTRKSVEDRGHVSHSQSCLAWPRGGGGEGGTPFHTPPGYNVCLPELETAGGGDGEKRGTSLSFFPLALALVFTKEETRDPDKTHSNDPVVNPPCGLTSLHPPAFAGCVSRRDRPGGGVRGGVRGWSGSVAGGLRSPFHALSLLHSSPSPPQTALPAPPSEQGKAGGWHTPCATYPFQSAACAEGPK